MKIRNGFVSNSSSSSFVVAFPSKPKNDKQVMEFMFGNKIVGGISIYDCDTVSYSFIAHRVFEDIKKRATINDIVNVFENRYHYHVDCINVFWDKKQIDECDGAWYEPLSRYAGSDKAIMEEIRSLYVKEEAHLKSIRAAKDKLIEESGIIRPKFIHIDKSDKNFETGKKYTRKQIEASDKYNEEIDHFRSTNQEYIKLDKELFSNSYWNKLHKLKRKMAKIDARNFIDDNKGKFIFIVEYHDNNGDEGTVLEHGDIFGSVPHVRISHH